MANFKKILWTLAAIPLLTACSNDDFPQGGDGSNSGVRDGDGVYMTVNFSPVNKNQTRSYTDGTNSSNSGVETGTDDENNIKRVLIVLATVDNTYIASATVENKSGVNPVLTPNLDNTIYQATAKFEKTDIAAYYSTLPSTQTTNPQVKVFLYCNPSDKLVTEISNLQSESDPTNQWVNKMYELSQATDAGLWTDKGFLMTNVKNEIRSFPPSLDAWNFFTTENNPFDLSGMNNEGTDNEIDNFTNGGALTVHRMAARFDFRDGSQMDETDGVTNGNGIKGKDFTYAVMTTTIGDEHKSLVNATIVNMSLVNMLNKEYYFERVSNTGYDEGATLLGGEKPWFISANGTPAGTNGNFVVSPYANKKGTPLESGFGTYFYYPFFDPTGVVATRGTGWFTTPVADVTKNKDGKYPADATEKYNRWRYVTENTIPNESSSTTINSSSQVNSWSTGIVFKAKLSAGDALKESTDKWDKALSDALESQATGPVLYLFSGKLYCGWEHVQAAALAAAGFDPTKGQNQNLDRAATLFKAVYGTGGVGKIFDDDNKVIFNDDLPSVEGDPTTYPVDPSSPNALWDTWKTPITGYVPSTSLDNQKWIDFRNAAVNSTFTIYEKVDDGGWGYYCYYFYWNRHNDNGENGVMAPMEFAVVRNNVYKLAVTRLNVLGHPRIPGNDPDSPKPDTPDEKSDLYLTVSVQVIPWVVRINNIEFW